MEFFSAYDQGFARVAACTSRTAIADPATSAQRIVERVRSLDEQGVALAVFPELGLTGYAIDDLLLQDVVLDATTRALQDLAHETRRMLPVIVVGAPLRRGNRLFNCAVVLHRGELLGVVPKSYLPNYREFYEMRHFATGAEVRDYVELPGLGEAPFGNDLLFSADDLPGFCLHVEVCEDMWVPVPPSARAALAGATVLANISGSPITVGKAEDRHLLVRSASARCAAASIYAAAGPGESSTDLSWDGQTMVYENGDLLAQTERFPKEPGECIADIDLDRLRQERMRQGSFDDNARAELARDEFRTVRFDLEPPRGDIGLLRTVPRFPFVPADEARLAQDCYEAYNIQVFGLEQRLGAIGNPKVVIGVSGGLDSTHALLVAAKAMDRLGRPRTDIIAITMPGFATTEHTRSNAEKLSVALGTSFETIDIRPACTQMLKDMGHPFGRGEEVYDVTFENVQAGIRTDYLFRIANQRGGIVLGTGDLSELALGWCTYGVGDQMSHYGVNVGVPKTLMQHLIRYVISSDEFGDEVGRTLQSILDTEITPELVPTKEGEKPQSTEASVGPYALNDFTLYHVLRRGYRPSKIAFLAWHAWHDVDAGAWPPAYPVEGRESYQLEEVRHWLELFCRRFVQNQFKRSALPNGPKVVAGGSLSPRGDWRQPSDANPRVWLSDLEKVPKK